MPNLYFGSFVYKDSLIHRLDPRIKLFSVFALSSLIFLINKLTSIIIFSAAVASIIYIAKMNLNYIVKNIKKFTSIFLLVFLMYALFSSNKITEGMIVLWQFLMLILISLALTYSTSLSDLTWALEKLSSPLKILRVKPRNIALMITVAIRFIPVMLLRLEKCKEALIARLADFKKLKTTKILVILLLGQLFASASNLNDAMSARLYNENAKSNKAMRLVRIDYISLIILFLFGIIIFCYN